ncbi:MAG: GAF domain-containing sensor histidine kinase [Thermoanaerobaculia bacterium]
MALSGFLLAALAFVVGVLLIQSRRVRRQAEELMALHQAALAISQGLELETILEKVVSEACRLLDARFGALSVVEGEGRIVAFVTAGISPDVSAAMGPPPVGKGLLGVPLLEGERLRLADLSRHPRSAGFPAGHPKMRSLLAVPVLAEKPHRGNLYLCEKASGAAFTAQDEETLVRFAAQAALMIDNSYLHQRLSSLAVEEERMHLAREIHDGVAQVLAYVNTKAQAAEQYLEAGRPEETRTQLAQLSAAAREVYSDVREGILGLRTGLGEERSLAEALEDYARDWAERTGIELAVEIEPIVGLPGHVELQVLRVVQEALANVRKHAAARWARLRLQLDGSVLVAAVEDQGQGFDPGALGRSEFPRFGLATMRERAQSVGGSFQVDSSPGEGTLVRVEIPLRRSA